MDTMVADIKLNGAMFNSDPVLRKFKERVIEGGLDKERFDRIVLFTRSRIMSKLEKHYMSADKRALDKRIRDYYSTYQN